MQTLCHQKTYPCERKCILIAACSRNSCDMQHSPADEALLFRVVIVSHVTSVSKFSSDLPDSDAIFTQHLALMLPIFFLSNFTP